MNSLTETTKLDDLPPEMICELFKNLCVKDLVTCSLVNKKWHLIFSGFKVDKLVAIDDLDNIFHKSYYDYNQLEWCYPNRKIKDIELFDSSVFHWLADQPLLSKLKYFALFVSGSKFDLVQLNKLNQFTELLQLEIHTLLVGAKKVKLNFQKLKILAIHENNLDCSLSIDCPELRVLVYRGGYYQNKNQLNIKHPEAIKKLHTDLVGPQLTPFKNVEHLVAFHFSAIRKSTLLSLPELKEIRLNGLDTDCFLSLTREKIFLPLVSRKFRVFDENVKMLKGPDFRFLFSGFEMTKTRFDEIDFGKRPEQENNEYVYMQNYKLIDSEAVLDFIKSCDYPRLISFTTGEIPDGFFKKFPAIKVVRANDAVQDEKQFLSFLKQLSWLARLILGTELSEKFYEMLPESARSLIELEIGRELYSSSNELQMCFNFIPKFSGLSHLRIEEHRLSFESLTSLIKSFGKLEECKFYLKKRECFLAGNRKQMFIKRRERLKLWEVYGKLLQNGYKIFETKDPNEVLNFLWNLEALD